MKQLLIGTSHGRIYILSFKTSTPDSFFYEDCNQNANLSIANDYEIT
jgi:hypothetical protein